MSTVEMPARDFLRMLAEVRPFASRDKWLTAVNCIRIEFDGAYVVAAATDKYSLGASRVQILDEEGRHVELPDGGGSIPLAAADRLARVFRPERGEEPTVSLEFGSSTLTVADAGALPGVPTTQIVTRLVTEEFPPWRDLFKPSASDEAQPSLRNLFNAKLIARFQHAQRTGEYMSITQTSGRTPMRVHIGDHFVGLVMSLRPGSVDESGQWQVVEQASPEAVAS